jgi:hypothetical protein
MRTKYFYMIVGSAVGAIVGLEAESLTSFSGYHDLLVVVCAIVGAMVGEWFASRK